MAYKRLQNTLAESRLMLPFAVAVTIVAVYLCGAITDRLWMQTLCLGISAYLMVELSNTHQEPKERMQRFEQRNKQFQRSIGRDLELCNNIELMLYSQKEQNVFDLAYACGQATDL